MSRVVKASVAFRKDTIMKLNKYMEESGILNRSHIVDEALKIYLAERSILSGKGRVGGAILVYYDHDAEEELTGIQHEYLDIVVSNTHMHIDRENCIEAILIRGSMERVRELVFKIEGIKDVKAVKYGFFNI